MFTFSRLKELDIVVNELNQALFRVCPELGVAYVISDCVELKLVKMNTQNKTALVHLELRNAEENAIMTAVKMFYYAIYNNRKVKSKKTVQEFFEDILHSLYRRWD